MICTIFSCVNVTVKGLISKTISSVELKCCMHVNHHGTMGMFRCGYTARILITVNFKFNDLIELVHVMYYSV